MGLGKNGQKVFVRKSGADGVGLYKWSPGSSDKKAIKNSAIGVSNYFCSAPLGSQGNDFIVTYTYDVVIVGGQVERHAYVQCDYVE